MEQLSLDKLADVIKQQCNKKEVTQEQLYLQTGIPCVTLKKIEQKDYIPSISELEKLAKVLEFDIDNIGSTHSRL